MSFVCPDCLGDSDGYRCRTCELVVLYRCSQTPDQDAEEMRAIRSVRGRVVSSRNDPELAGRIVICRYSALPFYRELEIDLATWGSGLVNTYAQHRFVADLGEWYEVLGPELTPRTWGELSQVPADGGPYVLKGETNSMRRQWLTHMYAEDRRQAAEVYCRLQQDSLVGQQRVYVRKWHEFRRLGTDLSGMPIVDEHRIFCWDGQVLASGFYWSQHSDLVKSTETPAAALEFVRREVLPRITPHVSFVAVDVAVDPTGRWWVVELNDGQMSGLSCIQPIDLYGAMADVSKYKAKTRHLIQRRQKVLIQLDSFHSGKFCPICYYNGPDDHRCEGAR